MFDAQAVGRDVCKGDPQLWLENYGKIKRKDGSLIRPNPINEHQRKICEVVKWCRRNKRPCRIVGLKPRQKGSSTVSVGVGYTFLAEMPGRRGLLTGGSHFQTANMQDILTTYATEDELGPACRVGTERAVFGNGSKMERITLANRNAGRSGTYQFLLITEVAYLAEEGVANSSHVLNGLLKCIAYEPDTIIIQESTAKGAQGDFYETYQKGITFEELQAGLNGYVKIFTAWYEFDDSRLSPASENIHSVDDLDERERRDMDRWALDLDQIAWMRYAIREECGGDYERFIQDYPFDDETCFLKSGTCRFNQTGLDWQQKLIDILAAAIPGRINYRESDDRALFEPGDHAGAQILLWERPKPGCRYLLSVDTSEGDAQTSGKDPDSHSIVVLRQGYIDGATGEWVPPAVVARNMCMKDGDVRFGCWWDIDIVINVVFTLSRYYGGCLIAPEVNCDRGLIEGLKNKGRANIYLRQEFNQRENKITEHYGWRTTPNLRNLLVETLASAVRESGEFGKGIELRCPWALKQFRNFVVKPNGRAEAATGHHDDDVMCIGIGFFLLNLATPYFDRQVREREIPSDLRQPFGRHQDALRFQNT